jgi:hypothetical protein
MDTLTRINNEEEWYRHCSVTMFDGKPVTSELFKSIGTGWQCLWDKNESITVKKMTDYHIVKPTSFPVLVYIERNLDDTSWGGGWDCWFYHNEIETV